MCMIVGGNQQPYGPVDADQAHTWSPKAGPTATRSPDSTTIYLVGLICSIIGYSQLSSAPDGVYTTSKSVPLIGIWVGIAGLLLGGLLLAVRGMSGAFRQLM